MPVAKRYCLEYVNGTVECFRETGFWYTTHGQVIKWSILGSLFALFMLWFIGGYIHARRRMKAGKPLLKYHRFLVSRQDLNRHTPSAQNNFTFYAPPSSQQNPYTARPNNGGAWTDAPPTYTGDAPPQYFAPGAPKQDAGGVEMGMYGGPPVGQQVSGVVGATGGGNGGADAEQGLPPRPPQKAKAVLKGFTDRFRK
ncbi:hypothetical protein C7974DRAFT_391303 [Boeremia exigua]|uniref:uncharacterized protein n=1 Tax=Boeremia exigua TaxID=749465 RepID=UPI001E8DE9C4|nr:uncharacterized protein C7974DRAFT_391303 [Boeremia exigua]KAH6638307.1 hypothetical protein C7974DRAFT_391303 [Boeremia exigua]